MKADGGVVILKTQRKSSNRHNLPNGYEYRVAYIPDMMELKQDPNLEGSEFNQEKLIQYFGNREAFLGYGPALDHAVQKEKEIVDGEFPLFLENKIEEIFIEDFVFPKERAIPSERRIPSKGEKVKVPLECKKQTEFCIRIDHEGIVDLLKNAGYKDIPENPEIEFIGEKVQVRWVVESENSTK